jgi:hypothetical protein
MAEADLELKYAYLGHRDTPERKANREHLQEIIDEIQAEQELKNAVLAARVTNPTRLGVAPRDANGIARR